MLRRTRAKTWENMKIEIILILGKEFWVAQMEFTIWVAFDPNFLHIFFYPGSLFISAFGKGFRGRVRLVLNSAIVLNSMNPISLTT